MADSLEPIKITAILTSAPGKSNRLQEVLLNHSVYVEANEPGTLQWEILKVRGDGDEVKFIAWECYKDKAAMQINNESTQFIQLMETLKGEALLADDIAVYIAKSEGGLTARRSS